MVQLVHSTTARCWCSGRRPRPAWLTCRHCRANAQRDPGSDDLSTAEGFALIDDLAAIGRPRPIMILTGGDCLMRNDLVALAAHAKQMDVPVAIAPSVTPKLTSTILRQLAARTSRPHR